MSQTIDPAAPFASRPLPHPWGAWAVAISAGVEVMLGSWQSVVSPAVSDRLRLTAWGEAWYRPKYDFPIYVGGILWTLLVALLLQGWWRRVARVQREAAVQANSALLAVSTGVGTTVALLQLLIPTPPLLLLLATATLLASVIVLLAAGRRAREGHLYLVPVDPGVRAKDVPRHQKTKRFSAPVGGLLDVGAIALILLLIYVPNVDRLVDGCASQEAFYHWDFYVMAPALAFRHGQALGTQTYALYGVGWPSLLAAVSGWLSLDYATAFRLEMSWLCLYFVAVYLFLRSWLRQRHWALAGTLLCLALHLWEGGGTDVVCCPSSSPMRYATDIVLFAVLLAHARGGRTTWGLAGGLAAGLDLLFATDSGLYLTGALAGYALALCCGKNRRRGSAFLLLATLGWLCTVVPGLVLASRGTFLTTAFWRGWLESIRTYGGGIANLPIGEVDSRHLLLLAAILGVYLSFLVRAVGDVARGRVRRPVLFQGALALYGFGTLILFVGRSHPLNLYHPIIPWCLLVTRGLAAVASHLERVQPGRARQVFRSFLAATVLAVVLNPQFQEYPGTLQLACGSARLPSVCSTPFADHLEQWQVMAPQVRQWSAEGRRVAVFGVAETACLLSADVPPSFRYCPLCESLYFDEQVDAIRAQLEVDPPDIAVLPASVRGIRDAVFENVLDQLRGAVARRLNLVGSVGEMEIYMRPANHPKPAPVE